MKKQSLPNSLMGALFVLFLTSVPAMGFPALTFVSATGVDTTTNGCAQTNPCATFQYAVNHTAAGGEVDALGAGNFGALVINNAITIDGKGLGNITVTSGQAIAVNAGSTDQVVLRNLSINGGGTGVEAIYFPAAAQLLVEGCAISGFADDSIVNVSNGENLYVKNTSVNGGITAVYINEDTGTTVLDHVSLIGFSTYGIEILNSPGNLVVNDSVITGGVYGVAQFASATGFSAVVERSTISGSTQDGLYVGAGSASVDSSTFFSNNIALEANTGGILRISNNNIYNNKTGLACDSNTVTPGAISSTGDNRKGSNSGGTAVVCPSVGVITQQ